MGSRAMHGLKVCAPARYADTLCDRLRLYMRPCLEHGLTKPADTPVQVYASDGDIWGQDRGSQTGRRRPWHPNVDSCMFYL